MTPSIEHDAAHGQFTTTVDGTQAVLEYRLQDGVMQLTHTGVPSAIGGRGVAAALVRAALDHAKAQGLRIEPLCAYVRSYLQRHPDAQSLLA